MTLSQNRFKHHFLSAVFGLTVSLSLIQGADDMKQRNEEMMTPQRNTLVAAVTDVEPTPGQKVAQLQAETLTQERFISVFGEERLKKLLETLGGSSEEGLEKFKILADATIDYEDNRKRFLIRKVETFMKTYLKVAYNDSTLGEQFYQLYAEIASVKDAIDAVPLNRIHGRSNQYFQTLYPGCVVTFKDKDNGVQLGTIATIQTTEGKTLKYYVKTHSGGLLNSEKNFPTQSSPAKVVDPKELLVYKVLEELGVGCESHFFGRDDRHLYIATLDANTEGSFKEYAYYKDAKDTAVQAQVWGTLTQLTESIYLTGDQHQQAEAWITADPVAKKFVHEMSKLDLLARLLWLTDFQTNTGNYGFVRLSDGSLRVKAIDFRLSEINQIDQYRCSQGSFESFLVGNGLYNYINADKVVCYALKHRQQELRVQEAKHMMIAGELSQFKEAVDRAVQNVSTSLNSNMEKALVDLSQYAEIIKANFQLFKDKLEEHGSSQE
jgi:hypothetical protein